MDVARSNLANEPLLRTTFVVQLFTEAHDPAAPNLDHRHTRLFRIANDVPSHLRVAPYVGLLEWYPPLFEVPLHTLALSRTG